MNILSRTNHMNKFHYDVLTLLDVLIENNWNDLNLDKDIRKKIAFMYKVKHEEDKSWLSWNDMISTNWS